MELSNAEVTSFILIARGEIRPPGVLLDDLLPIIIPVFEFDILDPGWKGLKPSNPLLLLDANSEVAFDT